MPVYDYVCRNCGHIVEVIHGVNASGPSTCTVCGGQLRKAVSAAAVVFKGSGWAKKDARTTSKPATSTSKAAGEVPTAAGDSAAGSTTESPKSSMDSSSSAPETS